MFSNDNPVQESYRRPLSMVIEWNKTPTTPAARIEPMSVRQSLSLRRNIYDVAETTPPLSQAPILTSPPPNPKSDGDKMYWAKPMWTLFHAMAENISDSDFQEVRSSLLNMVFTICTHLPCPTCSEHAKEFLNGVNFNTIQTREDLRRLFFEFHNTVNARKGFPQYSYDKLVFYKNADMKQVVQNFLQQYARKTKNIRYLADDFQRNRIAETVKSWFLVNLFRFTRNVESL